MNILPTSDAVIKTPFSQVKALIYATESHKERMSFDVIIAGEICSHHLALIVEVILHVKLDYRSVDTCFQSSRTF